MKQKFVLFFFFSFAVLLNGQNSDPVVFSIENIPVYRSEVEKAYMLDKGERDAIEIIDVDSFVQLYIDFKLNILEAKNQKLDTTANYKREYSSYKIQLSDSYLKNTEIEESVMHMLFDRTYTDIELNQAFIPFEEKSILFPSDTLKAYNEALDLRNQIVKKGFVGNGFSDYTKLPTSSPDINAHTGYLGWIVPFMLSRPVENVAYSLALNEISLPVRSKDGYHIIQVLGRRPARGLIDIDQVMFNFARIPAVQSQIDSVRDVANSVYTAFQKTNDWNALCSAYLKANQSQSQNCNFGVYALDAQLPPAFLSTSFALQNVGDVSQPVMTDYGFHIIRLNEKLPLPDWKTSREALRKRVRFTDRSEYTTSASRNKLSGDYKLALNTDVYNKIKEKANNIDPYTADFIESIQNDNDILFTVDDQKQYTIADFAAYTKLQPQLNNGVAGFEEEYSIVTYNVSTDRLNDLLNSYIYASLSQYAKETLEEKYPDFANLMNTFAEGTLYFDVKNKNVWSPSRNIDALQKFYSERKAEYNYAPFDEIKGQLEADYQSELEKVWTDSLRRKYKVDINEQVLKTIK